MNSGTIDLIATDPPFNKGRDFHATPDSLASGAKFQDRWSWADDVEQAWVDAIDDDWPGVTAVIEATRQSYGEDMAAFLCFLGVRVIEMHRVLKPTGSIYLHCDSTANGYIRALMDAVFGRRNFRNEIKWCYTGPGNVTRWFPRKSDSIFFYVKDDKQAVFNPDAVRVPFAEGSVKRAGFAQTASLAGSPDKDYEVDHRGKRIEDWWSDIGAGAHISKHERTGYPTQKPIALYERIIAASSNEGDMVLDPFAGCATTPVAAERLGRQWVGIDIWEGAHGLVVKRLRDEQRLFEAGEVTLASEPPVRTDGHEVATPYLQVTERYDAPDDGSPRTRQGMLDFLIAQHGSRCQGCDREFDDDRYLQLDHNTPRADGGLNHISNRVLLCGPCNRLKGAAYTLTGLRRENAKRGYMRGAML